MKGSTKLKIGIIPMVIGIFYYLIPIEYYNQILGYTVGSIIVYLFISTILGIVYWIANGRSEVYDSGLFLIDYSLPALWAWILDYFDEHLTE